MTTWLALIGLLAVAFAVYRLARRVGGLVGRGGIRPRRGGVGRSGGGTSEKEASQQGGGGRPRRPRRGGF